ncbi:Camkk protein kinase [Globisporangium polare]
MVGKPRWNIVETPFVEKCKTRDGRKVLNNYELLQTLGQGQFGKVKLCERIPAVAAPCVVTTEPTSSVRASASALEAVNDLLGPPPPVFGNGSASAAAVAVAAESKRRQFAIKIFSKKALLKMKEYVAETAQINGGAHSEDGAHNGVTTAANATRMRVVTALDHVRDEIAIMRTLYHRNIVLLFEVIESEGNDKIYMVLEVMARGQCMVFNAETKLFASPLTGGVLTDAWAKTHIQDILSGLNYLHSRRVCHRDLKPGNILLNTAGRCHLTDFGCAKVLPSTSTSNKASATTQHLVSDTVGTYQFVAPECCSGEPYDPFKVDVWATGILLYIFLYGKLPFEAESTKELFDEITKWDAETDLPPNSVRNVAPACRDLLLKLLKRDPNERISVADALHHPWLRDEDEDEEPLSF